MEQEEQEQPKLKSITAKMAADGLLPAEKVQTYNMSISNAAAPLKADLSDLVTVCEDARKRALYEEIKADNRKYYRLMKQYDPEEWNKHLSESQKSRNLKLVEYESKGKWGMNPREIVGLWVRVAPDLKDVPEDKVADRVLDLMTLTNKCVNKKGIKNFIWCLDQSSKAKENAGLHPHVHILIILDKGKQNAEPARMEQGIKNTFSRLGDTKSPGFIYIKAVKEEDIEIKKKYVMGIKNGKEKKKIEEVSKIWRDEAEIAHYFEKEPETDEE